MGMKVRRGGCLRLTLIPSPKKIDGAARHLETLRCLRQRRRNQRLLRSRIRNQQPAARIQN